MKGMFYWSRLNCEGFNKGLGHFQEAVARDPNFAPAYSGTAQAYFNLADRGCTSQEEAFPKSKAAALKAVQLDPGFADGHASLAELAFYYEWDWPNAEKEFNQAIELDANDSSNYASYAIYLVALGKQEQALAGMRKAQQLDPVSEVTNMMIAYVFYLSHQYGQAIAQAKKTLELYPGSAATYYWLGQFYEKKAWTGKPWPPTWVRHLPVTPKKRRLRLGGASSSNRYKSTGNTNSRKKLPTNQMQPAGKCNSLRILETRNELYSFLTGVSNIILTDCSS